MKKILLIDGSSLIFRAFYAIRNLTTKDGVFVNGVYGFLNMYYKALELINPTHIFVAFDKGSKTFRHNEFADYKGTRDNAPNEITYQFGILKDLLSSMNVNYLELDEYEADDIIGTIAKLAQKEGFEVDIFTGDRDYLQLVDDNILVYLTKKGISEIKLMNTESILEEYDLSPKQLIDVKALQGDSSDNIPGVKGVGEKTALKLIQEYGNLENLYENIDNLKGKLKENLVNEKDKAYLSRYLGEIFLRVPIERNIEDFEIKDVNYNEYLKKLEKLEFNSIINKHFKDIKKESTVKSNQNIDFEVINFSEIFEKIKNDDEISIKFFSDKGYIYRKKFYIGIYSNFNKKAYICKDFKLSDFEKFCNLDIKIIGYDIKEELFFALKNNLEFKNYEDVMILEYLIDSNKGNYDILKVSNEFLNLEILDLKEMLGKGKNKKTFFELEEDIIFKFISQNVFAISALYDIFIEKAKENNLISLYENVEKPLVKVLADMEKTGVLVDRNKIIELNEEYSKLAYLYEQKVYELAGEVFNLNSPKQLGVILFEKIGLPVVKKTKTGYSTDVEVLEKLSKKHEIADYILKYRSLNKLISTYLDGILEYIMDDGRVRTSFKQMITATGRLSSVDPNLQNIPIRSEEGKNIRKVFVADKNKVFIDADYSQIELRVLAHLSKDSVMIDSFKNDLDIHYKTASEVFGVPINEVTDNQRRSAKAVNFGIVYGISDYGLSKDLNITRNEARQYIDGYLNTYPSIKSYMEEIVNKAKKDGFVTTILDRKRYIPEINSKNFNIRSFGERIALNTPIQGSAADIIKLAMIKVYERLKIEKVNAKLILQIHDELIVECEESEKETVKKILKNSMENVYKLDLPLKVDICEGRNWYESK
ncbi:DNA polymerase I [Parvimonas micra]|uniref:DNA polymerase I n=1 Tax=Parvimonas micra TaxID=33033 RepID=UPI0020040319|nr:DNA polymerase I [Parvimonas micra]MCK6129785.1 DNA polymerase I [Parvimonas micra]MCK6135431.1 DNA polymerase I [Parvimonas micra]MCK6136903.1 DNA polymerase I [Parvimonas micra]MCK6153430.1 DNA polymerase I [Parvimonas micra]